MSCIGFEWTCAGQMNPEILGCGEALHKRVELLRRAAIVRIILSASAGLPIGANCNPDILGCGQGDLGKDRCRQKHQESEGKLKHEWGVAGGCHKYHRNHIAIGMPFSWGDPRL